MMLAEWQRRSVLLAVFYLLALAYGAIHPLHFVRAYWDALWPRFPFLPEQLFPATPWLLFVSVAVAIPPGLMLAAAWLGARPRSGRWFWSQALLLVLLLSVLLLGVVVVQLLFLDSLLPRLDPRALPVGVLLGVLLWLLFGRFLLSLSSRLSFGMASLGSLPDRVWQLRWLLALLLWWMWLLGGRWGWPSALDAHWNPGPWAWWWMFSWLALFSFAASGVGGADGQARLRLLRLLLIWLALSLVALACLLYGDWVRSGRLAVSVDLRLLAQQAGIVTGLLAVLAIAGLMPVVAGVPRWRHRQRLPMVAAVLMIAVAMLPVAPEMRLLEMGRSLSLLSVGALVEQFYQLIRDAILWLPVGFIFTIGGQQRLMWRWLGALCGGLLLVLLPWFGQWPIGLPASIGAAWAGLLSGVWLVRSSRPVVATVLAIEPVEVVKDAFVGVGASGVADAVVAEQPVVASRGNQFRRRQQSDAAVAGASTRTAWRQRGSGDEPAAEVRGGFRTRTTGTNHSGNSGDSTLDDSDGR